MDDSTLMTKNIEPEFKQLKFKGEKWDFGKQYDYTSPYKNPWGETKPKEPWEYWYEPPQLDPEKILEQQQAEMKRFLDQLNADDHKMQQLQQLGKRITESWPQDVCELYLTPAQYKAVTAFIDSAAGPFYGDPWGRKKYSWRGAPIVEVR